MDGWIVVTNCANCNSAKLEQYKSVTTAPAVVIDFCGGILPVLTSSNYVRCSNCGLVIQSPRMTDERISQYYSSGLYRDTLGLSQEYMDADEQRRALDVSAWLKSFDVTPNSHIDIGASRGYLLQAVGANVKNSIDLNPSYAEIKTDDKSAKYELVTAIHVLEHTTNPISEIAWYKSLSSDKVLIEVPGEHCKGGALRFAHLYYFPPFLLTGMLESAGMKILAIETLPHTRVLAQI